MTKLAAIVAISGIACAANTQSLERKVDQVAADLQATRRELSELRERVDRLAAPPVPADADALDRKIDALQRKLEALKLPPPSPSRPPRAEPDRAKIYAVPIDGHPSQGPRDAKVTMVIAHDYADPYSDRVRATLDELRRKYGNDLRLVYRNLVVHPRNATAAALASCAAAKQGKFDAFEVILWERGYKRRQFDLTSEGGESCWTTADGCTNVVAFAKDARLDVGRFRADMTACQVDLAADMKELQAFGLAATPSFFINGRYAVGAQPTESFVPLIDEELARATERIKAGTPRGTYYQVWVLDKGLPRLEQP